MSTEVPALPAGTAVLHIGPHKTGTTALQHAFHRARADLAAQGVRYASTHRHDSDAARFAVGVRPRRGAAVGEALWRDVVAALQDTDYARRLFCSESLANATDEAAARVVADVGPVDVVMVARPLADLVPSQYQQLVQRGATTDPFDAWTDAVFGRRDDIDTSVFWRRHRIDEQVRRWGDLVGYDRVTVVVSDGRDRRFLPSVFEQLLDVAPGTLADQRVASNRSLSAAEVELLRQTHKLAGAAGLTATQRREILDPVRSHLQSRPDPGASRLHLTPWAVAEANAVSERVAASVADSGARVIGDLSRLAEAGTR